MHTIKTGRTMKYLLISCLFLFFAAACTEEIDTNKNNRKEGNSKITFSLKTGSMITRSGSTIENSIKKLDILVFEENNSGDYTYQTKFTSEATESNLYEIELNATGSKIKLCVLVNAFNAFETINENELWDDVIKNIVLLYDGTIPEYLPMFGEAHLEKLEEGDNISLEIDLLRALASVEVCLQTESTDLTDKFELVSIQAYRANDKIQAIPDSYVEENGENGKRMKVLSPTIPSDAVNNILTQSITATDENPVYTLAGLYIPEAEGYEQNGEETSESTCIIIGGKYEGKLGYYRVDIKQQNTNKIGQVLRNYKYQIVITNVTGPGYEDPEEAGDKPEISISTDVIEWEEGEDGIIYGPDGSYFGITADYITVNYFAGANNAVSVRTNNANYTIEWLDEQGNGTNNIIIPNNEPVSYGIFSLQISEDGTNITTTALEENTSAQERSQKAKLTVGSLHLTLMITQQTRDEHARDYIQIFNFTGANGCIGDDLIDPLLTELNQPSGTVSSFRKIINNKDNFGPTGTIAFGGFFIGGISHTILSNLNASEKDLEKLYDLFDVMLIPDLPSIFGSEADIKAQQIVNWLNAKNNRVLFVYNSCEPVINILGKTTQTISYWQTTKFWVPENIPDFIKKGPFGIVNSATEAPVTTFTLSVINKDYNPTVEPILVNEAPYTNEIIFGIDRSQRVVFLGDHHIFTATSSISPGEPFISDDGVIRKNSDVMIANVLTWVAETVLGEELAADKK